jgi:O-antigen/teichoic acid export membrane protein
MGNIGRRGAHATLWSALEIGTRYSVQIAVTIVLARLLNPADFGLLAILLVFTSVGALLTDAGLGAALIQKRESTPDDEVTIFYMTMLTGGLAALVLWMAAPGIAEFYRMPNLLPTARAIAWILPMGAIGAVPDALLTKRLDFKSRTHAQLLSSLISGLVGVLLALKGAGVWSLVFQALTEAGIRSLLLWVFSAWRPRGRFNYISLNELFGFGGFMLLSGILSTVSTRIQSLLIGKLFDARELGLYTLAQNASQAPASFTGGILNRVGLPLFSGLAPDKPALRLALSVSLQVSMFAFLPCMVGIALAAHPLIELVYGNQWTAAAPMLSLLALATALWPIHVLNLVALSAQGRSDLYFRLEIFKNLTTMIAAVAASPLGPVMVAGAMLVASLCAAIINTWYSGKILGYGLAKQISDQARTFLAALLSILPAGYILYWAHLSKGSAITCAIITACLMYLGCSMVLKNPALKEIRSLLHSIFSKHNPITGNDKP